MNQEPTRIRLHGTRVTSPKNPQERIDAIRRIVDEGQFAKVDGSTIDLFSASAIVSVYDLLNEKNRTRFASLSAPQMAQLAFRLIKR